MDLCKDITSGGELNDIAISCGIELRNVETAPCELANGYRSGEITDIA